MGPFVSYNTFVSSGTAAGALIRSSPDGNGWSSDEGTEAGDGLADDEVLHLVGAFVGVERFGIGEEACDLVVAADAVAAQQLPGPGDSLPGLGGGKGLGQGRVGVRQLALDLELRHAGDQ